ncbi:hypothetical protein [Yoonia maritima]|uniref:hypothetical protein n=1 Tax=Yoonia maritima TaxID=1435347 RepID=UPI000D0F344B|nr:hypothetical protein [Yoonia maritima]
MNMRTNTKMDVTRGLIIADPWIGHILEGRKNWEMRSQATSIRGWFGLIQKGSGHVVGLARLVDCGKALPPSEMIANIAHHQIPEDMIRRGEVSKWVIPWKLADIIPLERPVPYQHKSGAVTWVTFSPDETRELNRLRQGTGASSSSDIATPQRLLQENAQLSKVLDPHGNSATDRSANTPSSPLPEGQFRTLGRSHLTGGNIRNNHINLSRVLNAFPQDVIGGKNKSEAAPRQIEIDWGGPQPVLTDIDGSKSIFRGRGWVRRFFAASGAQEGDYVVIVQTASYKVSLRLERAP